MKLHKLPATWNTVHRPYLISFSYSRACVSWV